MGYAGGVLEILIVTYAIWVLLVFIAVAGQSRIWRKSWHYRLHEAICFACMGEKNPKSTCSYMNHLMWMPLVWAIIGFVATVMILSSYVVVFIVGYIVQPLFCGKVLRPREYIRWITRTRYFADDYIQFSDVPPIVWILFIAGGALWTFSGVRIFWGDAGFWETGTWSIAIVVLAAVVAVYAGRGKLGITLDRIGAAMKWLKDKTCYPFQVID